MSMRPEFLNRIDEIIMFNPLTADDVRKIAEIQFGAIQRRLKEGGIRIEADSKVLDFLGKEGFSEQYGARPLKRVMEKALINPLSKKILAGEVDKESLVGISLGSNDDIEFLNLDKVEV